MGGDGAPAKGRGRFRKTGWCYPPESLLRAEADSGGDDDGPALVRPGASPPRSPRGAAPSGVERWPSARTPKVGGDRSAPRVDRFVLAPLLKIMRAALARRDHPRADHVPRRHANLSASRSQPRVSPLAGFVSLFLGSAYGVLGVLRERL